MQKITIVTALVAFGSLMLLTTHAQAQSDQTEPHLTGVYCTFDLSRAAQRGGLLDWLRRDGKCEVAVQTELGELSYSQPLALDPRDWREALRSLLDGD